MGVHRLAAALKLAALLAAAAAAVWGLHGPAAPSVLVVDWADPIGWAQRRPPADVAAAGLRLVGLGLGWWLLGSTTLYLAARAVRLPAAIAAVEWATLPAVRRLGDRAVAVSLAGSVVLGGAAPAVASDAEIAPPRPVAGETVDADAGAEWQPPVLPPPEDAADPSDEHQERDDTADSASPGKAPGSPGSGGSAAAADARDATRETGTAEAAVYEVAAGDHLWGIAEETLAGAWGRPPAEGETAGYWRRLIAANRGRLASGDPDLIYPGEGVRLPDIPDAPDPDVEG